MNFKSRKTRSMTPISNKENSNSVQNIPLSLTPKISSRAWIVYDCKKNDILMGNNIFSQRQVASLTKIMTFYTALQLCENNNINLQTQFYVSKLAAVQEGTSANLYYGSTISIEDLFYALMLPSGNDAAMVLAEGLGMMLRPKASRPPSYSPCIQFVQAMQSTTYSLQLNSKWANPHGLQNAYNKSSAYDIAKIAQVALQNPLFKKIVQTKQYKQWSNTNKLLDEGWCGIKTGITPSAGPCLAAAFDNHIIVLLGCKSMEQRWDECRMLKNYLGF